MIQKIDLKDRIAILTEENICDLLNLYGELNIDRLSRIVNNHIRVAIDEIRELQPGAVIFIQGIMYVSDDYSKAHDIVNNDNIIDKNNHIAALANGVDIFYLDMNPAITDDSGYLDPDLTWDGVHLQAQYYSLWVDFLKSHGLDSYMFE